MMTLRRNDTPTDVPGLLTLQFRLAPSIMGGTFCVRLSGRKSEFLKKEEYTNRIVVELVGKHRFSSRLDRCRLASELFMEYFSPSKIFILHSGVVELLELLLTGDVNTPNVCPRNLLAIMLTKAIPNDGRVKVRFWRRPISALLVNVSRLAKTLYTKSTIKNTTLP